MHWARGKVKANLAGRFFGLKSVSWRPVDWALLVLLWTPKGVVGSQPHDLLCMDGIQNGQGVFSHVYPIPIQYLYLLHMDDRYLWILYPIRRHLSILDYVYYEWLKNTTIMTMTTFFSFCWGLNSHHNGNPNAMLARARAAQASFGSAEPTEPQLLHVSWRLPKPWGGGCLKWVSWMIHRVIGKTCSGKLRIYFHYLSLKVVSFDFFL